VAKSTTPLSFLGELDTNTGKVDNPLSELNGRSVAGKILVFPEAKGSTVGPYVLYGAWKRGVAPAGVVVRKADAIVASAAVLAKLPCVAGVDIENIVDGDEVMVNGTEGFVEIPQVKENQVVTSILQNKKGEILLLKRSDRVGTFKGKWSGVSGYIENRKPLEQAYVEIEEELGLHRADLSLAKEGATVYARQGDQGFVVHPFLFRTSRVDVRLDWENVEHAWIDPKDLAKYPAVPALDRVWANLSAASSHTV
jgi:hypothetical protein